MAADTKKIRTKKGDRQSQPSNGEVKAIARYIRTAPRKLRLVADMIRGKKASEDSALLLFTPKRAEETLG